MKIKINKYGRAKSCPNCKSEFVYSWLSGMSKPLIFMYSSSSDAILVSKSLAVDLWKDDSNTVNSVISAYLGARGLEGYSFALENSLKCPVCKFEINRRSEQFQDDSVIFLDGMKYFTDDDAYFMSIEKKR